MKKLALFALLASASMSFGQWFQPWTPNLSAFESRVVSCGNPQNANRIAADDFTLSNSLQVTQINWWGTVTAQAQLSRRYYIAIYKSLDNCTPAWSSIVYRTCVIPTTQFIAADCLGNRVFKFFHNLPLGSLNLGPGQYWIQISEDDQASVQPGVANFGWSSHDPIEKCPALQLDVTGLVIQPLIERCTQRRVDLAFEIL